MDNVEISIDYRVVYSMCSHSLGYTLVSVSK